MKPLPYFSINNWQITTHRAALLKLEATLNANANATLYLQIHDTIIAPAAGAVPLKSWPAAECGFKEFELGELRVNAGLFIGLSSTSATYTAAAGANDKCDILNIELIDPETPTGTGTYGDLSNNRQSLQVWPDLAGPKKLLQVEVDNTGNGLKYLMLFAYDTPQNGDKPIDQFTIKAGEVKTGSAALSFGSSGRSVFSKDSAGVEHDGCTLVMSDTTGTLTQSSANFKIKAEYL